MIEKAMTLTPDEVFFDLEDACAPREKTAARAALAAKLPQLTPRAARTAVRINAVTTAWCFRDVIEITQADGPVTALIVPKVEQASHVHFVAHLLDQVETDTGCQRRLELELLIETARGVVNLKEILAASDRTAAIVFGPGDYAASMAMPQLEIGGSDPTSSSREMLWAQSEIAAHARAAGIAAIDGPLGDFRNEAVFRASAQAARRLGFDGKWCVHPDQIGWANEAFSPSPEEVEQARAIIAAWTQAAADGLGAVALEGRLVDEASRRMAEATLQKAEQSTSAAP